MLYHPFHFLFVHLYLILFGQSSLRSWSSLSSELESCKVHFGSYWQLVSTLQGNHWNFYFWLSFFIAIKMKIALFIDFSFLSNFHFFDWSLDFFESSSFTSLKLRSKSLEDQISFPSLPSSSFRKLSPKLSCPRLCYCDLYSLRFGCYYCCNKALFSAQLNQHFSLCFFVDIDLVLWDSIRLEDASCFRIGLVSFHFFIHWSLPSVFDTQSFCCSLKTLISSWFLSSSLWDPFVVFTLDQSFSTIAFLITCYCFKAHCIVHFQV